MKEITVIKTRAGKLVAAFTKEKDAKELKEQLEGLRVKIERIVDNYYIHNPIPNGPCFKQWYENKQKHVMKTLAHEELEMLREYFGNRYEDWATRKHLILSRTTLVR